MPDPQEEEEEEDVFLGRNIFMKEKSPTNLAEHLNASDENMLHFKALLKYYGIGSDLVNLPDCVKKAKGPKYKILTPDA